MPAPARATRDVLLDTGPLVAVLDAGDRQHRWTVPVFSSLLTRLVTTEAVVTEATHLVGRGGGAAQRPLELLLLARIPILGLDPAGHQQAARLMERYADTPMDYADATLMVLADGLEVERILTFDRRGFGVYRRARGGSMEVVRA